MLKRSLLIFFCISLTGCSTLSTSSTFRNRNFDYDRTNVVNLDQPIATPQGLSTPDFSPHFNIPPGQNFYPGSETPNNTTEPPGYNTKYPIPPEPTKPVPN